MTPDVLFWFYKEFEVCRSRLELLRHLNPQARIYGLYGGPLEQEAHARRELSSLLDDFYAFPEPRDPQWKWRNGDRLIAAWHRERGQHLPWDTLFVHEWDMLSLAPLSETFAGLQPGEILLSGYRPLQEVQSWWPWVNGSMRQPALDFAAFQQLLKQYQYHGPLFACLFIVVCLPRRFLDRYIEAGPPECGFLEYKIPTLAALWQVPVHRSPAHTPWWAADPATRNAAPDDKALNAVGQQVPWSLITEEFARPQGRRLFHPVYSNVPALDLCRAGVSAGESSSSLAPAD